MCGFAGSFDPHGSPERLAARATAMVAPILHRGPDDGGVWVDGEAGYGVGFRRLAIRDLSPAGHQPMLSASGRWLIAFNGEIYDDGGLERDLTATGVCLRGSSDTEVLLEACARWGVRHTVTRVAGMFAFALWDRQERRLTLGRDRLGKKPLYWSAQGGRLLFGSQLKCLLAVDAFEPVIDQEALALYLRLGYVPGARSILAGVQKLPPGHLLEIDAAGGQRLERYWDPVEAVARGAADPLEGSDDDLADELEATIRKAVSGRMLADVPLGAFLSGGIDSSTVVALMQAQSGRPVRTFAIGSADPEFDESGQAAAVARHLGTDHTGLVVGPAEAMALVPDLPVWFDEPFADASAIPTMLVSQLARSHVTVALSGDGGDELLAGYRRYGETLALARWHRRLGPARGPLGKALALLPQGRLQRLGWSLQGAPERLSLTIASHWRDPARVMAQPRSLLPEGWDGEHAAAVPDLLTRLQLIDLAGWLPEDILTKLDRASMAVSLEARCPLLDHRVVELAFRLPRHARVRGGVTKWLLRRVLERHVPRGLTDRPKRGFSVPIHDWLRGPLRPWADSLLEPGALGADGLFRARPVLDAWAEHLSGRRDHRYPIWNILMFQAWKHHWLDGRAAHRHDSVTDPALPVAFAG